MYPIVECGSNWIAHSSFLFCMSLAKLARRSWPGDASRSMHPSLLWSSFVEVCFEKKQQVDTTALQLKTSLKSMDHRKLSYLALASAPWQIDLCLMWCPKSFIGVYGKCTQCIWVFRTPQSVIHIILHWLPIPQQNIESICMSCHKSKPGLHSFVPRDVYTSQISSVLASALRWDVIAQIQTARAMLWDLALEMPRALCSN